MTFSLLIQNLIMNSEISQLFCLENKMVNAFFPMKKDGVGFEGSGM